MLEAHDGSPQEDEETGTPEGSRAWPAILGQPLKAQRTRPASSSNHSPAARETARP